MRRVTHVVRLVLATLASLGPASARADCDPPVGKIVVARFVRCESGAAYLYSAMASQDPVDPRGHAYECAPATGEQADAAGAVLVAWGVSELPLEYVRDATTPHAIVTPSRFVSPRGWQPVQEPVRYEWRGTLEECRALAPGALLKLRVRAPCCDATRLPIGCVADLLSAWPVTADFAERLPIAYERPLLVNDHPLLEDQPPSK